jgi:hypothetical protein
MTIFSLRFHAIIPLFHYSRPTLSLANPRPLAGLNDVEQFRFQFGYAVFDFGFQIIDGDRSASRDDFLIALPFTK